MCLLAVFNAPTCSEDISEFAGQEYAGKDLLAMGVAELDNLELAKGPRRRLIESIKKLKAAAAA